MSGPLLLLGGGGFTSPPGDPALDDAVLDLTGRVEPRVLFLPTASGDAGEQVARFQAAFGRRPVRREVLSLFRLRDLRIPLEDLVLQQDVIYVGGGSLRNLLALWREHALDDLVRRAWEGGAVLAGLSAGAMCWLEGGVTMSAGAPEPVRALGFMAGSLSVHRDTEPERLAVYRDAVQAGVLPAGWAVDDGAALLLEPDGRPRILSARAGAGAERVERAGGGVRVTEVEPEPVRTREPARTADPALDELRALRELRRGLSASR